MSITQSIADGNLIQASNELNDYMSEKTNKIHSNIKTFIAENLNELLEPESEEN